MNKCLTCRMSPNWLVDELVRHILCQYCINFSNYDPLSRDDIARLKKHEQDLQAIKSKSPRTTF